MIKSEEFFLSMASKIPKGKIGKLFGAHCLKSENGKAAAIYWQNNIMLKLNKKDYKSALELAGAKQGFHLYDPTKPMKEWVSIPFIHFEKWTGLAKKALKYVD